MSEMNPPSDHGTPEDRPTGTSDAESGVDIPEWAPMEPLPSSHMLLAAFDGKRLATARDILDPAFDLVACQKQYRLAFEMLGKETVSAEQLWHAASELVTAQQDIEILIAIIDDAVADRLKQRIPVPSLPSHTASIDGLPLPPVHTESIGEIAARMADLWEAVTAKTNGQNGEDFPEAGQLLELCRGYDYLAAEIESGRRLLPGM
ncbi:hypothetical protein [Nocardia sp. CA-119907]|uniref:hypothetical protein n=1 Tax=Nocardia sp. CA-119907 TaxID=3239973 RepID=UPI003D958636